MATTMDAVDLRRYRRYNLRFPVHLRFRSGCCVREIDVFSKNISMGGLFLESTYPVPYGTQVQFTLILSGEPIKRSIVLEGEGQVVRLQKDDLTNRFGIAFACERPVTEIAPHAATVQRKWTN